MLEMNLIMLVHSYRKVTNAMVMDVVVAFIYDMMMMAFYGTKCYFNWWHVQLLGNLNEWPWPTN